MRIRAITTAVTAAAVVTFALVATQSAVAGEGGPSLLARYQPVTVLDAAEPFVPTAVGSFVRDAVLETQTAPGVWSVVDPSPSTTSLPAHPSAACTSQGLTPCYRLNQPDCSPADGPDGIGCYRDAWLDPAPKSIVYGHVATHGTTTALQYWYFTYDDLYSYNYPPDGLFWQAHEGDWEMVTVVVRQGRPVSVGYSQHCTGERRAWSDVERWNGSTHPVVYVAEGSHANLFAAGEHPIDLSCIPQQAIDLLTQFGLPMPNDHAHPGTTVYGPAGLDGVTPTTVSHISKGTPRWTVFDGTWGELEMFHAPAPIGTVPAGYSPTSPALRDAWRHPLRTVKGWPITG